ncbi:PfkB family carbohydrate kinase [Oerskovia enterophila]|uniref:PfkB family carbohydrate kinase n=1 Tax=Oerskovia enterophila TaxID=43678 RepID=UPI003393F3CD
MLTVGETMVQLTPVSGPLRSTRTLRVAHGGCESNIAVWLARLGVPVAWLSKLGADPLGDQVIGALRAEGVDTHAPRDERRLTGLYLKDPAPSGTRVHYLRSDSAATQLDPALFDTVRAIVRPATLVTSGITAALSPACLATVEHLLSEAGALGATTVFDVNYRPSLWEDQADAATVLGRLADCASIVFVGLDEARALWRTESAAEVRRRLPGPHYVVVKDAEHRATTIDLRGRLTEVPALAAEVVEPTGAGDAFAAGWLYAYLQGLEERSRLRLGHLLAGAALQSPTDHGPLLDSPAALVAASAPDAPWPPPPFLPHDGPPPTESSHAAVARPSRHPSPAGRISTEFFDRVLAPHPVLAILRGLDPDRTCELLEHVAASGLRLAEIPVTGPEGWEALAAAVIHGRRRGIVVGAGTILNPRDAERAVELGAAFTVSPGIDEDVVQSHGVLGVPHLPGVATASEVGLALALGLRWQKAYPASLLETGWFRALASPFPQVRWVATGGVDINNARPFHGAGAAAVALGSSLANASPLELRALLDDLQEQT